MRIRKKHFAIALLVFIAVYFVFCAWQATAAERAGTHPAVNLTIRPPSYAAWRAHDDSWWRVAPPAKARGLPRIGTLTSGYAYLDGLPVRQDFALALQTGALGGFYRFASYRLYAGGAVWQPVFKSASGLPREGAFFVGLRAEF